jgi:hypothetical protein
LVLQVAVKIKFKSASRATGWNVDSKKASGKKQVAGPGLIFVEEELYDG